MSLNTGLIHYYKLESSSTDSIGSNNGTDTTITYSAANGKVNNGAGFGGASFIDIGNFALGSGDFTIAFWFKTTNVTVLQQLIGKDVSGTREYTITIGATSGKVSFLDFISSNNVTSSISSVNNTWEHICITRISNVLEIFNNNVSGGTAANTKNYADITKPIQFGAREFVGFRGFLTGAMDEIGFWNRGLTSAEITELYNGGNGLTYPFPSSSMLIMF
jgi:hypothetical protein